MLQLTPVRRVLAARAALSLSVGLSLATVPAPAFAQDPAASSSAEGLKRAREQFGQALALQTAGDWAGALALLKDVAAVKSTPQVRFNMALCEEKLGKLVAALGDYELAAADARAEKADQVAEEVESRLESLRQRIPKLTVTRGSGADAAIVAVDGVSVGDQVIGLPMPTDPGPHTVEGKAPGFQPFRKSVRLAEQQSESVEIVLEPEPPPAPAGVAGGTVRRGPGRSTATWSAASASPHWALPPSSSGYAPARSRIWTMPAPIGSVRRTPSRTTSTPANATRRSPTSPSR
jgi:hypothetical protein